MSEPINNQCQHCLGLFAREFLDKNNICKGCLNFTFAVSNWTPRQIFANAYYKAWMDK